MTEKLLRTPLYEKHLALEAKMVPFAGYDMPVQYPTGIKREHLAVRDQVGLFDVSHMGEIFIEGPRALAHLNRFCSNRFDSMTDGRCRYTVIMNEKGGILDDLLVYRCAEDRYLLVVNAANRGKVYDYLLPLMEDGASLTDASDLWGQVALQGPKAEVVLRRLTDRLPEKFYTFLEEVAVAGVPCLISRTGYTGEDGFEIYAPAEGIASVWDALLAAGAEDGILPCGLGARDTLRLEAALPLYGNEMDESVDPLTAGLGFAVKLDKDDFIGKAALLALPEDHPVRVGLKVVGRGIARQGAVVCHEGEKVGRVTSGTQLPYLKGAYAMAYVPPDLAAEGTSLDVLIREKPVAAEVVALPFYKRQ